MAVEGTVEAFDATAFKTGLASVLDGVEASDIDVQVRAASIIVDVTIETATASVADAVVSTLASPDASVTIRQALDVEVSAISSVEKTVQV